MEESILKVESDSLREGNRILKEEKKGKE